MCFLPLPNLNFDGLAYKKGVREFDCGACPECLRKRSNIWALRAVYEAKQHVSNCMITLTYDHFQRDSSGRVIGELPVNPVLTVNKRDIQLFIKRLRKWCSSFSSERIKYIACAEYGSRTHRAHYHLILFGVKFPDLHFYKKSKRGNPIYMSNILTCLWNHGICTVDSIRVVSAVARYCTKYCAKSRSDDTFMLCSQKIGFDGLLRDFNGRSYMIDGREYPIPRFIWEHYIVNKYQKRYLYLKNAPLLSPKYVNRNPYLSDFDYDFNFERSKKQREFYRRVRDKDKLYSSYLDYWRRKGLQFEQSILPARQRLLQLSEASFHNYKVAALRVYDERRERHAPIIAPNSRCVSAYARYLEKFNLSLVPLSRPNRTSDTKSKFILTKYRLKQRFIREIFDIPPVFVQSAQQICIDLS